MHRTTGDGYEIIGDKRFNVNQDLGAEPPEPGTRDTAEDTNAMQEELCNAIVRGGLEVIGDDDPENAAALDELAGWDQLATAIFDSEAIDTEAIADEAITSTKLEYPLSGDIWVREGGASEPSTFIHGNGVRFKGGPGPSESDDVKYRKSMYWVTDAGLTWDEIGSGLGIYKASDTFETDIPSADVAANRIFRLTAVFESTGTGTPYICSPVHALIVESGGYWRLYGITVYSAPSYPPGTSFKLIVEYDAQDL